ncbi:MAG: LysO family transporter [Spirochaetes bacterium]|nr:LysO family transporter [Spirochaetota bacterium]
MLVVTSILAAGVLLGLVLKDKKRFIEITGRTAPWIVYMLLFLLGIVVGTNETVTGGFIKLGIQASVLSAGGVAGSVCLAVFLHKFLFEKGRM